MTSEVENSLGLFLWIFLYIFLFTLYEENKLFNFCFPVGPPGRPLGPLLKRALQEGYSPLRIDIFLRETSLLKRYKKERVRDTPVCYFSVGLRQTFYNE